MKPHHEVAIMKLSREADGFGPLDIKSLICESKSGGRHGPLVWFRHIEIIAELGGRRHWNESLLDSNGLAKLELQLGCVLLEVLFNQFDLVSPDSGVAALEHPVCGC